MSTATAFKYHRPFPFCVSELTDSAIAAIAGSGTTQLMFRWKGTLADAMALFWNTETISTTLYDNGITHNVTDIPWMESYIDFPQFTTQPQNRVCWTDGTIYGATDFGAFTGDYFSVMVYAFYKNTTTGDYEVMLQVFFNTTGYFASYYSSALGYTDPFTADVFGQTFTFYSTDAANIYCDDITLSAFTY